MAKPVDSMNENLKIINLNIKDVDQMISPPRKPALSKLLQ
jgi:hypothetical protein